jgi:hypothetical protein
MRLRSTGSDWGRCPQSPGIYRIPARIASAGRAPPAPGPFRPLGRRSGRIPASPLSSAQVTPGWTTSTSPCNDLSANGDYPLNFVSHSRVHSTLPSFLHAPFPAISTIPPPRSGQVS